MNEAKIENGGAGLSIYFIIDRKSPLSTSPARSIPATLFDIWPSSLELLGSALNFTILMASPPPQSVALALDSLLHSTGRLPERQETMCSCGEGTFQCAYLTSNNAALESLEKDLQNAAQIGQVGGRRFRQAYNSF